MSAVEKLPEDFAQTQMLHGLSLKFSILHRKFLSMRKKQSLLKAGFVLHMAVNWHNRMTILAVK